MSINIIGGLRLIIPIIILLIWFICYTNDRLYCFFKGIDYNNVTIVDYGYAKVIFENNDSRKKSKTSLEDINGIVKTDEPTNSVELKKELYK